MRRKQLLKAMLVVAAALAMMLAIAGPATAARTTAPVNADLGYGYYSPEDDPNYIDNSGEFDFAAATAAYGEINAMASDSAQQQALQILLAGLNAGDSFIYFPEDTDITVADARAAARAITGNPEYFFLSGSFGYSYWNDADVTDDKTIYYIQFDIDPNISDIPAARAALEMNVATALTWVSPAMSDLQKAQAIHDYLVRTCAYDTRADSDTEPWQSHTAYGALVSKTPVCQGYGAAYKLIMDRLGIPCVYVSSRAMNHGWNMIMIEGQWYHVDVTWDDPQWTGIGDGGFDGPVVYTYFLRSDASMSSDALGHYGWVSDYTAPADYPAYTRPEYKGPAPTHNCATDGHVLTTIEGQAATCTQPGWAEYQVCEYCDYTTYEEIDALGHDIVHHDGQAATCEEAGWHAYDTCTRCDYTTYEEIPLVGHDIVIHPAQDPTCTEAGWYSYITCANCGYSSYRERPALGHSIVHHAAQAPTCTEAGWDAYDTCSRCDYSTYEEIPAGHDIVQHEGKPATCTTPGWDPYETCTRCDYSTYHAIPMLGHDCRVIEYQEPTCTEPGWNVLSNCSRCGYGGRSTVPALGHKLEYHAAQAPTCTESGWYAYEACTRCDYSTFEERAALGHDIVQHDGQAPTCTEAGWDAYDTCTRCDYSTYTERAALGHAMTHFQGQAPTLYADGWEPYDECARCGFSTFKLIPKLAPTNGWVQDEGDWYYVIDGAFATGWQRIGGKYYWFDAEGRMATGVTAVDGEYYLFAASGAMTTGWTKVDGRWYCADSNGVLMHDEWGKGTNGKWYYLGHDCVMYADGMYEVEGEHYWFDGSGNMLTGWILRDGKWYLSKSATSGKLVHDAWGKGTNGKWYYLGSDCVMYASGKYWVDGDEYVFDASGNMLTGWISYQGEWYHSASSTSGKLQHSAWFKSGGYWYWMDESGVMVHDCTLEIGGVSYEFDSKGHML